MIWIYRVTVKLDTIAVVARLHWIRVSSLPQFLPARELVPLFSPMVDRGSSS